MSSSAREVYDLLNKDLKVLCLGCDETVQGVLEAVEQYIGDICEGSQVWSGSTDVG